MRVRRGSRRRAEMVLQVLQILHRTERLARCNAARPAPGDRAVCRMPSLDLERLCKRPKRLPPDLGKTPLPGCDDLSLKASFRFSPGAERRFSGAGNAQLRLDGHPTSLKDLDERRGSNLPAALRFGGRKRRRGRGSAETTRTRERGAGDQDRCRKFAAHPRILPPEMRHAALEQPNVCSAQTAAAHRLNLFFAKKNDSSHFS